MVGIVVSTAALLASLLLASSAAVGLAADVACGVRPLDVVLIIDRSGSMQSNQSGGQTRLHWAKAAANQLVDDLDGNGGVGATHQVGLTTFGGSTASVNLSLGTSTAATVHGAINAIWANGGTPLKLGMATGVANLAANQRTTANDVAVMRVVVLLSDGRPNPDPGQRPNAGEIAAYLASADVAYSIAVGAGGSGGNQLDLGLMQGLANPEANFRHVVDAPNLPGLFADIFTELTCPQIAVEKTPSVSSLDAPGGPVTYTYDVTNSNPDAALSSVVVSDDKCSPVSYLSGDTNGDTRLQATETWVFSCTATLTATTTNVATASGEYNGVGFTAQDVATVVVLEPTPTPVPTPTPTPTPTPVPTPVPTPTPTPLPTPTATPLPTPVATPTPTPEPTPSPLPVPTPTADPTPTPIPAPTATEMPTPTPFVAYVPTPSPTPAGIAQQPASPPAAPDTENPLSAMFGAAVEQVSRVVKPEAVVAVAATFGFPLGMNLAVVLFLVVQGGIDSRDPKLRVASQTATEAVVAFEEEEQL
ncbi:MAG TPA: vWA domain-containing protein [Candidatus Dormibacteraeota bacterium]|nr:vWA domain-containing protein [Candidatus Dormibacteraeota bacterium]